MTAEPLGSKGTESKYKERLTTPEASRKKKLSPLKALPIALNAYPVRQNQMQGPPRFLVQDDDGALHAYYREDILQIDLAINREHPPKQIFRLSNQSLTLSYHPIDTKEPITATTVPTEQTIPAAAA